MPRRRRVSTRLLARLRRIVRSRSLMLPVLVGVAALAQLARHGPRRRLRRGWLRRRRRGCGWRQRRGARGRRRRRVHVLLLEVELLDALLSVGLCFCGALGVDALLGEVVGAAARDD